MKVKKSANGKVYLHVWRTGKSYMKQKGDAFRRDWTNIMFSAFWQPRRNEINYYDIRKPLPFPDATFNAVYAYHIVEHLTLKEAEGFIQELYRVLKLGGVLRMSTPDLEEICIEYLNRLNDCLSNHDAETILRYHWAKLELLDQMVRDKSGGGMKKAILKGYYDYEYAKNRYGDVFDEFIPSISTSSEPENHLLTKTYKTLRKIASRVLLRKDPRKTLELNKWLHDRVSLKRLLEDKGFVNFSQKSFNDSDIPKWEDYNLDASNFGDYALEPSIYVEAMKKKN